MENFKIFCGNASAELASSIANNLGVSLGKIEVGKFSDGETRVEIMENVRGREVFIVQSTCYPANDNLMELVAMADAFRRASAGLVTAVIPYFGYARQDRRVRSARVPVTAKVVADILASVDIDRIITVDLHADQIQGFFCVPVDNVYASQILLSTETVHANYSAPMIVSPDVGGVVRARAIAKSLSTELAIIDKRRPEPGQAEVMHVIGDVSQKNCIIVDDMVDTAGTLCQAARALKEHGAKTVTAYCTHPVLSGKAIGNVEDSVLDALVVSDSIPLSAVAASCAKIQQVTISGLLAKAIYRIKEKKSLSAMFA